ncbi:MBL fold metallo-hydrolase RNA specificity domain-containing protein [Vibrio rumoiensis]|uniref:MBL fold hydrolase n=1 Tax=Vibrio rumoiensis 1S-45 TaxID=1188252 RepID=A0A1E5E685_9VIBR|nr:MBL fold metallo-hydrolase [Vibrio rumoiensis]OEF29488.1 MBL fold hydrolase [Vibrio rumoiensis 1S-45]
MLTQTHQLHSGHNYYLSHHGGKNTVTGSCHELSIDGKGILIDCGLFQGNDAKENDVESLNIEFPIEHVQALIITHTHIDHIGRLPWLLAAGFDQPIYCTEATAALIPLMLDDGLRLQLGLNAKQRKQVLARITKLIEPIKYHQWLDLKCDIDSHLAYIRFSPAGHILGSAYVEIQLPNKEIIVFSGDLGPRNTPLLPDPVSPQQADYLVIETTYGDQSHDNVATRSQRLEAIVKRSLRDGGVILIPAFSVGRTQEILFDIERLIAHSIESKTTSDDFWQTLPIILDSPLALKVTKEYKHFKQLWNEECLVGDEHQRHPLSFEQLITIDSHKEHQKLINRLSSTNEAAIVVAASGMCNGGRIMNYLTALLPEKRTDLILAGYQANGTLGRKIQQGNHTIYINEMPVAVHAQVHTMSGYSAHADQDDLLAFIKGIPTPPKTVFLIHGESDTKEAFKEKLTKVNSLNGSIIIS